MIERARKALSFVGRFSGRAARLARRDSGMAAVEFSLILPILVVLWFGGVELTQGLSVDRRVNNLSSSIGDLVARSKVVTFADVDAIFGISTGAMFPYSTTGLQMRITAVDMSSTAVATSAWSRASGITAYADNSSMTSLVPATLRIANTQVIMAEVFYTYTPAVGYVITGSVPLSNRMYFVPRLITKIQLCDNSNANCKS